MMMPILLGRDLARGGEKVFLDPRCLSRHLWAFGATGAGKTTALHAIFRPIMMDPREKCSLFLIDPMGNLSFELLRWIASRHCPEHVRRRLVYIEPARSEVVLPFNPLRLADAENRYYQVARAVDLILRAWKAQDLSAQPRLMQWSYKAVCACAALGVPLAMTEYLLHPGTDEHRAILQRIPGDVRHQWMEILNSRGGEAVRILESTRNRFEPLYTAPQIRRMFSVRESRFDVEQFIRERKIVIVNVAKLGKLPRLLGDTIGSLFVNEILETVFRMATVYGRQSVEPTFLILDEAHRFISPDLEDALPTCRQMGLRLVLAHQSMTQLIQGDIDMSGIIWQARNRLMFANAAEDADLIAKELAILSFDPRKVKDIRHSRRQLIAGYRIAWLESEGWTSGQGSAETDSRSVGYGRGEGESGPISGDGPGSRTTSQSHQEGHVTGGSRSTTESRSHSRTQHLVPIHDNFDEVSSVTYTGFEEHRTEWERIIRQLKTGQAFGTFVDDPRLYHLQIHHAPLVMTKSLEARYQDLLAWNFEQNLFVSREEADRLAALERRKLLEMPPIEIRSTDGQADGISSHSSPFT